VCLVGMLDELLLVVHGEGLGCTTDIQHHQASVPLEL
jgi:hypothetical protein